MAKLTQPWDRDRILGLKGVLDFYTWKGIPVVRSWPRTNMASLTANTIAQWPKFAFISQQWKNIEPAVAEAYQAMAVGTQRTGRDYQIEVYYYKSVEIELA
jgi:hypothetical protein